LGRHVLVGVSAKHTGIILAGSTKHHQPPAIQQGAIMQNLISGNLMIV